MRLYHYQHPIPNLLAAGGEGFTSNRRGVSLNASHRCRLICVQMYVCRLVSGGWGQVLRLSVRRLPVRKFSARRLPVRRLPVRTPISSSYS